MARHLLELRIFEIRSNAINSLITQHFRLPNQLPTKMRPSAKQFFSLLTMTGCAIAQQVVAQENRKESLAGESSAMRSKRAEDPAGYNLHWGPASFSFSASLRGEFNDNVLGAKANPKADLMFNPEVRLGGIWPITALNTLSMSLGVGAQEFVESSVLSSDVPLISPDSELAFQLYTGDFRIRFRDRFTYQESIYYQDAFSRTTGDFVNLNDIGKFGRFENVAGVTADWDKNNLVLTMAYDHNDFIAFLDQLNYLTRQSENLALTATFSGKARIRYGAEFKGSYNNYEENIISDHERARLGPFLDVVISPRLSFRLGSGYDGVYLANNPNPLGQEQLHGYYAYGTVSHALNRLVSYYLGAGHENRLGWQNPNAEATYVELGSAWTVLRNTTLNQYLRFADAEEQGGRRDQAYTALQLGVRLEWTFAKRWSAQASYDFTSVANSTYTFNSYDQQRIGLGTRFRF